MFCICGVCIPMNAIWPIVLFLLKPIWNFLRSWYTGEPVDKPASKSSGGSCCEGGVCSMPKKIVNKEQEQSDLPPLVLDGNNLITVSEADDATLFARIKASKNGAIVRFTASWCKPCKQVAPFFNELSKQYKDVIFATVDVDENSEIAADHGVIALPAFHFYRDGEVLGTTKGSKEEAIQDLLDVYVIKPSPSDEKPKVE